MRKAKEILAHVSVYAGATFLTQAITLVASVASRRFLGPTQMGIWAFLQIIETYASFSALGTTNAVTREIPFYLGKKQEKEAEEIKNNVFTFAFLSSVIVSAGILIYALAFRNTLSKELFWGLCFVSLLILLQRISDLMITVLRAYKQFGIASREMIYSAIVNTIAVAVLSYYFRIYGFMWAMALSFLFNIVYMLFQYPFNIRLRLNARVIKKLIAYGFPLMILGSLAAIYMTIDKLMIKSFYGYHELGLYSVAVLATNLINKFPLSVGTVLLPNFHEKYGERESREDLEIYLRKSTEAFSYGMPVLIAFAWFFAPPAIMALLPEFKESIPAVQILMLSGYFLALSNPYENFIIALRRHMALFPVIVMTCILAIVFNALAIYFKTGIWGIALATTLVSFCKVVLLQYTAFRGFNCSQSWLQILLKSCGHFSIFIVTLLIAHKMIPMEQPFLKALLSSLCFLILYSPWLYKLNRNFGISQMLFQRLQQAS